MTGGWHQPIKTQSTTYQPIKSKYSTHQLIKELVALAVTTLLSNKTSHSKLQTSQRSHLPHTSVEFYKNKLSGWPQDKQPRATSGASLPQQWVSLSPVSVCSSHHTPPAVQVTIRPLYLWSLHAAVDHVLLTSRVLLSGFPPLLWGVYGSPVVLESPARNPGKQRRGKCMCRLHRGRMTVCVCV